MVAARISRLCAESLRDRDTKPDSIRNTEMPTGVTNTANPKDTEDTEGTANTVGDMANNLSMAKSSLTNEKGE